MIKILLTSAALSAACSFGADMPSHIQHADSTQPTPAHAALWIENDMYAGADRDYTSGVKLEWMSSSANASCVNKCLGALIGGGSASSSWWRSMWGTYNKPTQTQWGLTLTQLIFTPSHREAMPYYDERPYAGHLALGIGSHVKTQTRGTSFEFQLGCTGDSSLAKQCQRQIHKMWGTEQWKGWQYQIPSEVTFNFYLKRYYSLPFLESRKSSGWGTDGYAFWHADAGTVYVRGGVGCTVRCGFNLPSSSAELAINSATYASSPFIPRDAGAVKSRWSAYGFCSIVERAIWHDIFLDGPVFHDSRKYVSKESFVCEMTVGIGVKRDSAEVLFGYVWRQKEFKTQIPEFQGFGTLQLRYSF